MIVAKNTSDCGCATKIYNNFYNSNNSTTFVNDIQ